MENGHSDEQEEGRQNSLHTNWNTEQKLCKKWKNEHLLRCFAEVYWHFRGTSVNFYHTTHVTRRQGPS
jgi:hypothetical protein